MRYRQNELSIHDLKNISLWYDRATSVHDDMSQSDKRTMIKIQAMLIYQEEDQESFKELHGID